MHFRVYRDLEFGLGSWRQREDLLELKPHVKAGLPSPRGKVKRGKKISEDPEVQPKRVSITAEDRALLECTQSGLGDGTNVSDDEKDRESSKVAAILREMSKSSSSTPATIVESPAYASLPITKRSLSSNSATDLEAASKRVRWSTESLIAPHIPQPLIPSREAQQTASNRFFHKIRRGVYADRGNVAAAVPRPTMVPTVPVLKPIAGLRAYDVLLGRDFISHFNLGNRRFMILASPHLGKFAQNPREVRTEIAGHLMATIGEAGGRFVCMEATCGGFQELSNDKAMASVLEVLQKLSHHSMEGRGLVRMFQRDCASAWGGTASDEPSPSKKQAQAPSVPLSLSAPSVSKSPPQIKPFQALPKAKYASGKGEPLKPTSPDFQPGEFDVICCRGRSPRNHAGNLWFSELVESKCEQYVNADGKMAKSVIVTEVLDTVRRLSESGAGFVKRGEDDLWYEVGDHLAREKIGQVRSISQALWRLRLLSDTSYPRFFVAAVLS